MYRKGISKMPGGLVLPSFPSVVIIKGLLWALLATAVILMIISLIFYFTPLSEIFLPYAIFGGTLLSILIGSMYVGKNVEEKGWLRGGLTGLFYSLLLFFLGLYILPELSFSLNLITKLLLGFSFGVIGGILGINS